MQALNAVPDGQQPKSGFDLMSFETFTQKGGMLNVVGARDTVPNSDYRMAVDAFTRSLPCNTANFAHIKENYYFVHVPLGLISRNAYQTLVQRKQEYSALDMGIVQFPTFNLAQVLNRCLDIAHLDINLIANQKFRDVHGFNIGRQAFRLFDMLGYGCYLDIVESTFKSSGGLSVTRAKSIITSALAGVRPTANRLAAYQMIWYYFFRNDIYDNSVSARCFNFDDVTLKSSSSENYDILATRNIDDFIIECCQMRYVGYKKDLFMGSMPGTQYGAVSSIPVNVEFSDLAATFVGNSVTPTGQFNGVANTSNLQGDTAYDFGTHSYIHSDTQTPVLNDNLPNPSNYVFYANIHGSDPRYTSPRLGVWPKVTDSDLQMQVSGAPSYFEDSNETVVDVHTHHVDIPFTYTPRGTISLNPITPSGTVRMTGTAASASLFDVLQLVQAQAIQKWRQKSMLAGNKTADQFRAHHGEVPRHLIDHLPDFIGSVDNEIQITEITSQADTAQSDDESNLGEIAGRGYGASNAKYFHQD